MLEAGKRAMATQAQITANQKNAILSTGPVSVQGKQIASRNSGGPVAAVLCIATENQAEFDALQQGWVECFKPQGEVENNLVNEIVMSRWRQQRLWIMETVVLNRAIQKIKEEDPAAACYSSDVLQGLAAIHLTENSKTWATLQRYERSCRRSYERAVAELRTLQAERKQADEAPQHPILQPNFFKAIESIPLEVANQCRAENEPKSPELAGPDSLALRSEEDQG